MFLNAASDSPRLAYEAYLDRLTTSAAQAGPCASGSPAAGSPAAGAMQEEEFYAQLEWLDELSMREIEGRLSRIDLERMHELQALLLGESPHAVDSEDRLEFEVRGSRNDCGQLTRSTTNRPSGARRRRDLWRQLRREDRSAGE